MSKHKHQAVESRNEPFVERTATRIWHETPCEDNPYIAESALCHGYELSELMDKCRFTDMFYLLFRGELPTKEESKLLEALMIGLINPGPRHAATRAAMAAGVGKTLPVHILPIALSVMGGEHLGGGLMEDTMRFLRKHYRQNPDDIVSNYADTESCTAPGFGCVYGGIDTLTHKIAEQLVNMAGAGPVLQWGHQFAIALHNAGFGWQAPGLAAAVFCDLGFQPKAGGVLLQLLSAPGLAAHGLELANKPYTAMPYVKDENYVIEN